MTKNDFIKSIPALTAGGMGLADVREEYVKQVGEEVSIHTISRYIKLLRKSGHKVKVKKGRPTEILL